MENIINLINKIGKSTKSTLSSLQKSYSPHYIDIEYTVVDKVINYGMEKYYPNKTIIRLDNFDSIVNKRVSLNSNLLTAMNSSTIKYFLFIFRNKIYPLSMIDIIADDRYLYLLINSITEGPVDIKFFLFPFKIEYKENDNSSDSDIRFTQEIFDKYKNNIIINLLDTSNVVIGNGNTDSNLIISTDDIRYRTFGNNILFFNDYDKHIIRYSNIKEYPANIFKINRMDNEPSYFYYYAFYNKNIIDEQVNFVNQLLSNKDISDSLVEELGLEGFDFDFTFDKELSYEENINKITNYILGYDPSLFNSLLSNKNIEKKYYTGDELLSLKDNDGYINFSNYRKDNMENYVIIYVNGKLYDYHELIIKNNKGTRIKLIDINSDDNIEIVWYYNIDNSNYVANIPNIGYEYDGFKDYIRDNINTLEIFSKSLPYHMYDILESDNLLYKIEYSLINNKNINFGSEYYYNTNIIISSKRQFRYMRVDITESEVIPSKIDLSNDFNLCNNLDQYMVFVNNKFQSINDYSLTINKYDNPVNIRSMYLSSPLVFGDQVDIFYIPYPYGIKEFSKENDIIGNGILYIDSNEYLGYPYNRDINDIFINSSKIWDDDIKISSSNMIKIMLSAIHYDNNIIILEYINEYLTYEESEFGVYFRYNDNIRNQLMVDMLNGNPWLLDSLYNDFSNALYVAGGDWGKLATSTDGINWIQRDIGFGDDFCIHSICYGNGLYIVGGNEGKLVTSIDGTNWIQRTNGFDGDIIYSICYGNGLYVIGGTSGKLATSIDGINWIQRDSGFNGDIINSLCYGNGLYIVGGENGKLSTSIDGINWIQRDSGFDYDIFSICYGNGLYVAVGNEGKLATSTDGINWIQVDSGFGTTGINSVCYGNGLYIAVGNGGKLATSADGINWVQVDSGLGTSFINSICYGNGLYIAGGTNDNLTTSTDGINWIQVDSGFNGDIIYTIYYGDGLYITEEDYRLKYYLKYMIVYQLILDYYIKSFGIIDASKLFTYSNDPSIVQYNDTHYYEGIDIIILDESNNTTTDIIENKLGGKCKITKNTINEYSKIIINYDGEDDIGSCSIKVLFSLKQPLEEININKLIVVKFLDESDNEIGSEYMIYEDDKDYSILDLMGNEIIFRLNNIPKCKKIKAEIKLYNINDSIYIIQPLSIESGSYTGSMIGIIPIDPSIGQIEQLPYNWEEFQ